MAYFRFRRSTEVKRCFTEVKVIFTEEKPRSTEVKSRLTVVKPRFTECAMRFIEVLDPSGNRDSITSRGAKRPCRHGARAQKRPVDANPPSATTVLHLIVIAVFY